MRGSLFTATSEYACVAMLELASRYTQGLPVPLKTIAEGNGIDKQYLVQVLLQLKAAGLVTSTRGASGGYLLARPPEQITLADVLGVIEPDRTAVTRHAETASPMTRTVHSLWNEIALAQRRVLQSTSLADLLRRAEGQYEVVYQI